MKFTYDDGGRKEAGYNGRAGDCVIRAITITSGYSYQSVYKDLTIVKGSSPRNGTGRWDYHNYILSLGFEWVPCMKIGTGCKVHMKEEELPKGRLIVRLSKHLAAVINGELFDTHDCSRNGTRCVYGYYIKKTKDL